MSEMTLEQIERWLVVPKESQSLEFIEGKQSFDTSKLRDYCVAIANEGGGFFVLGITDKVPRQVVGSAAFADPNDIAQKLRAWLGLSVRR